MKIVIAFEFGISRKPDGKCAWSLDHTRCAGGCHIWSAGPFYLTKLCKDCT